MNIIAKVFKNNYDGKVKANASITIDEALVVTGLRIIEGSKGLFVSMPQRKVKEEYKDLVFPLNKELREQISTAVLKEYSGDESESDDDDLPW